MAPRFEPRANMEDLEASFLDKKKKDSTKWKDGVFYYTLCSAYALAFCIALTLLMLLGFLLVSNLQKYRVTETSQPQVPCFFIFGDSISDNGNNNDLVTMAKANYQPYGIDFPGGPTGRFTNGRNLVDIIAELLGFASYIPPFATARGEEILKGVNYASGAAGIREESGQEQGDRICMDRQLQNHQITVSNIVKLLGNNESLATAYLNKCIYSVAIGSNDYLNNYFLPQYYNTSSIYNEEQYAAVLAQQLYQQLLTLHKLGARKVALFGLGLLGYTPVELATCSTNGSSCVENIDNVVALFNDKLVSLVDDFNSNLPNATFIFINTTQISLNSSSAEVTDVPCCEVLRYPQPETQCVPLGKECSNRSEYSFWDAVHPTEAAYVVYGERAYRVESPTDAYPFDIESLAQL
ncbi:GDSL esterase/lipase At5g45670-like [Quercus lobata]|uniref:GDSL esterase/lipase n=1 Tax=Quercus lobata TaxID=97700 RepID=A0A7N2MUK1_QUELO|nr:GDSL esterase/lipase At5g45670-like [Quercus lobata]